jgi:MmgE/PrpD N-terminal domain
VDRITQICARNEQRYQEPVGVPNRHEDRESVAISRAGTVQEQSSALAARTDAPYLYQAQNQAQSQGNRSEGRNAMAAAKAPATVKDTGNPARPATDPAEPTGRLATWVAKTTLDDVPASVRDRAKHLMLDGIGCALVGAQLPWSRIGVEGVTALDDAGECRTGRLGRSGYQRHVGGHGELQLHPGVRAG